MSDFFRLNRATVFAGVICAFAYGLYQIDAPAFAIVLLSSALVGLAGSLDNTDRRNPSPPSAS